MGFYVLNICMYLLLFQFTNIFNLRPQLSKDNKLLSEFGKFQVYDCSMLGMEMGKSIVCWLILPFIFKTMMKVLSPTIVSHTDIFGLILASAENIFINWLITPVIFISLELGYFS